jgi:hypothetical protein
VCLTLNIRLNNAQVGLHRTGRTLIGQRRSLQHFTLLGRIGQDRRVRQRVSLASLVTKTSDASNRTHGSDRGGLRACIASLQTEHRTLREEQTGQTEGVSCIFGKVNIGRVGQDRTEGASVQFCKLNSSDTSDRTDGSDRGVSVQFCKLNIGRIGQDRRIRQSGSPCIFAN